MQDYTRKASQHVRCDTWKNHHQGGKQAVRKMLSPMLGPRMQMKKPLSDENKDPGLRADTVSCKFGGFTGRGCALSST